MKRILFLNLVLLFITNLQARLICSDPLIFANETTFQCNSSDNYIAGSSVSNFPSNTEALTVVALFTYDGQEGIGCKGGLAYPMGIFSLSVRSGGSDVVIMELVQISTTNFQYVFMGTQYSGQGYTPNVFIPGNQIEVKIAVDFSRNQADMATTYFGDVNYDAPLPQSVNFTNTAWAFDQNTKFWFGGGPSATQRHQIRAPQITVWDGYLPLAKVGSTPYPGEILLGHTPILVADYKLQDLGAYGLTDEGSAGAAYLGKSTPNASDDMNAPSWVAESPKLEFSSPNDYLTIPTFDIGSPYAWVKGSLTVSFWIQPDSAQINTNYIFRFMNASSIDRFAIKITTSLSLQICASMTCGNPIVIPGLSSSTWTLITVSWAFIPAAYPNNPSLNINFYYSVYSNGQLVQTDRGNQYPSALADLVTTNSPTDVVRFGGFLGKLGAIKIHSPGSLLANLETWCSSTTCAVDLGVTNPPTCLKPASCHSSCSVCTDDSELGCLVCTPEKYFSNGKCVSCPAGSFFDGTPCASCIANCDVCSDRDSCTQCSYGFYVHADGQCHKDCPTNCATCRDINTCLVCYTNFWLYQGQCLSSCPLTTSPFNKTCQDCGDNCDACKDGMYSMNSSCYNSCPSPFTSTRVGTKLYCESDCLADEYNYWEGCEYQCVPPLLKSLVNGLKVCSYACQNETDLLYWNGTCSASNTCDSSYTKFTKADRDFCIFTCPSNKPFSYYNDTCQDSCSPPLVAIGYLCAFPCQNDEFLYWDNSCKNGCPFPYKQQITQDLKRFCLSPCSEDEYLDDEDGLCKSLDFPAESFLSAIIGGQPVELTFIDKLIDADSAAFTIFSYDYTLESTWSFFGLNSMGEYKIDNWETSSQCGCFEQICGQDCANGIVCSNNAATADTPWVCHPWATKDHYCWSVVSAGEQTFTYYNLTHISTVALTSYGGPDNVPSSPGFTITNSFTNQDYALGAAITSLTPRHPVDLASYYRYIESEGMVITTTEFNSINTPPTVTADLKNAYCKADSMDLPLILTSHAFTSSKNKTTAFHSYSLLRRAQLQKLTTLNNQEILSPQGVLEWSHQATFDILDPCNQQFFTLQQDRVGNFFVKLPSATQRLATDDSTICIAVNDVSGTEFDLVLYEIKNGSSIWTASNRFVGVLSKDFVQDMVLRINTKANTTINVFANLYLSIEFATDVDNPYITITSSLPTTCQLYLSPSCTLDVSTTAKYLYARESIAACGKYLYEKAGYNCQGVSGYFYPPSNLVKTRINYYSENTTHFQEDTEDFSAAKPSKDDHGFLSPFQEFFTGWTWANAPTKILRLIFIGVVIASFTLACKFYKNLKGKVRKWKASKPQTDDASVTSVDPTSPTSQRKKLNKGYANLP